MKMRKERGLNGWITGNVDRLTETDSVISRTAPSRRARIAGIRSRLYPSREPQYTGDKSRTAPSRGTRAAGVKSRLYPSSRPRYTGDKSHRKKTATWSSFISSSFSWRMLERERRREREAWTYFNSCYFVTSVDFRLTYLYSIWTGDISHYGPTYNFRWHQLQFIYCSVLAWNFKMDLKRSRGIIFYIIGFTVYPLIPIFNYWQSCVFNISFLPHCEWFS